MPVRKVSAVLMYYMETLVCVFQQVKDMIQQRHSYNSQISLGT